MVSLTEYIRNFKLNFFTYLYTLSPSLSQRPRNEIKPTKCLAKQGSVTLKPNTSEVFTPSKLNGQNDSHSLSIKRLLYPNERDETTYIFAPPTMKNTFTCRKIRTPSSNTISIDLVTILVIISNHFIWQLNIGL